MYFRFDEVCAYHFVCCSVRKEVTEEESSRKVVDVLRSGFLKVGAESWHKYDHVIRNLLVWNLVRADTLSTTGTADLRWARKEDFEDRSLFGHPYRLLVVNDICDARGYLSSVTRPTPVLSGAHL
jgi:hypothetical protein